MPTPLLQFMLLLPPCHRQLFLTKPHLLPPLPSLFTFPLMVMETVVSGLVACRRIVLPRHMPCPTFPTLSPQNLHAPPTTFTFPSLAPGLACHLLYQPYLVPHPLHTCHHCTPCPYTPFYLCNRPHSYYHFAFPTPTPMPIFLHIPISMFDILPFLPPPLTCALPLPRATHRRARHVPAYSPFYAVGHAAFLRRDAAAHHFRTGDTCISVQAYSLIRCLRCALPLAWDMTQSLLISRDCSPVYYNRVRDDTARLLFVLLYYTTHLRSSVHAMRLDVITRCARPPRRWSTCCGWRRSAVLATLCYAVIIILHFSHPWIKHYVVVVTRDGLCRTSLRSGFDPLTHAR